MKKYKIVVEPKGMMDWEATLYRQMFLFFWKRVEVRTTTVAYSAKVREWQWDYDIKETDIKFNLRS